MGSTSLPMQWKPSAAQEKKNPQAKLSFYFPIRREGMISLLAVAKAPANVFVDS